VPDGAVLKVPGPAGGGDLYLRVAIRSDPRFERRGDDLHVELPITITEATLGGEVPVPTPEGEARVRVPPSTPSGRKLRLQGRGMPAGPARGDLYATIRIVPPPTLSPEEREILERLAAASNFDPRRS
jgi:curved DNA-binding protein